MSIEFRTEKPVVEPPITSVAIKGQLNKELKIESNIDDIYSLKGAKEYYQQDRDNRVFYIAVKNLGEDESEAMGLSIEEAEAVVKALSSMISYVKS